MHDILTDIYYDTRVQFGYTPQDNTSPGIITALAQDEEPNNRKKRSPTADNTKSSSRVEYSRKNRCSHGQTSMSVEDVRRSKLHRNRIAASKCRRKKKQWIQGLERRARELQTENHSLRMTLDSMRDELISIKSGTLYHRWMRAEPRLDQFQCIIADHQEGL